MLAVLLRALRAAAAIAVVGAIVLAVRLAQGPIDLSLFKPRVESALSDAFPGAEVRLRGLRLDVTGGRAALTAFGARAKSAEGRTIARAGRVDVDLDIAALLRGEVRPTALAIVGARLIAERGDDGRLRLIATGAPTDAPPESAPEPAGDAGDDAPVMDVAGRIRAWLSGDARYGRLPDISFRDAELIARDGATGEDLWRGRVDAGGAISDARASFWAEIAYDPDRSATPLHASAALSQGEGGTAVLVFADGDLGALARVARLFGADSPEIEGRVSGSANLRVDAALEPASAAAKLAGTGLAAATADGARLAIDRMELEAAYDAAAGEVKLSGLRLGAAGGRLIGAGTVARGPDGQGLRITGGVDHADIPYLASIAGRDAAGAGFGLALSGDFDVDVLDGAVRSAFARLHAKGRIERDDLFYAPLPVDRADAVIRYDGETRTLTVKGVNLDVAGVTAAGAAEAGFDAAGALDTLTADAVLGALPSERLAEIWPRTFSQGGRDWVARNLSQGRITAVDVRVRKASGAAIETSAAFAAEGLTVRYWDPMPVAENIEGTGRLIGDRLEFHVTGGQSDGLTTDDVKIEMSELGAPREFIAIDGAIKGPADKLLAVLDRKPLGYAQWLGVDPATAKGAVDGRLRMKFPLIDAIAVDDIEIGATGVLTDATLPGVVNGWDLERGDVKLDVDAKRLHFDGKGRLLAEPATFKGDLNFGRGTERARIKGTWRLTRDVRREIGLGGAAFRSRLAGVAPTAFDIVVRPDKLYEIGFDADLTDATVLGQEIGWVKPKGALAHVSGRAVIQGDRALRVEDIALAAGDLGVEAGVAFDPATGAVSRVSVRRLKGAGHDLAAEIALGAAADDIRIYGRAADLRPLLEPGDGSEGQSAAQQTPPHPSRIRVDLDQARLTEGLTLARFRADMTISDDWPSAFAAEGDYPGGAIRIAPDPERTGGLVATASEFGRLLEGVGVTEIVRGGKLTIRAAPPTAEGVALDAHASDFDVDKADLARIAGEGSTDLLSVFDGGDRINFDRLLAKAVYKAGVIQIEAAQASGAGLGVSAAGLIDLAKRAIDIQGAIAPAYGFSRVIGGIPLLGDILTGSKKEGVFAATYRATGDLDDPGFEVNGLSALAPGILREALQGAAPSAPKPDGAKPKRSQQYDYDRNSD